MEINDHKVSKARGEATMARWERKYLCNYSTYTRIAVRRHRKTIRHATRLALRNQLG